jgi:hypothetical protein
MRLHDGVASIFGRQLCVPPPEFGVKTKCHYIRETLGFNLHAVKIYIKCTKRGMNIMISKMLSCLLNSKGQKSSSRGSDKSRIFLDFKGLTDIRTKYYRV